MKKIHRFEESERERESLYLPGEWESAKRNGSGGFGEAWGCTDVGSDGGFDGR